MDARTVIRLGPITMEQGLLCSPLAGITKRANRVLARRYGCEMTYTEMIKAAGLVHGNARSWNLLKRDRDLEDVLGVQLAESDPECMAEAVRRCVDLGFDVVDINMGCPSRRIANGCAGAGMLRDPENARVVMRAAMREAGDTPVTCKIRLGWDHDSHVHLEFARMAQQEGLQLITVHGRVAKDTYGDPVRHELIREVVEAVDIPVVANGNVRDGPSAVEMFDKTGCAGVMVGRASQGNPWVFRDISAYLRTGESPEPPELDEVVAVLREHFDMLVEDEGARAASLQVRKLGSWYLKGYVTRAFLHENIFKVQSPEDLHGFLDRVLERHQGVV